MRKTIISLFLSFLILITCLPVQADTDNGVVISIEGGIGLTINIENNNTNKTVAYNYSIDWRNIFGRTIHTTNGEGMISPEMVYSYSEAPVRFFTKIHVIVESEEEIVEKDGIAILVFVKI